jgi:hypothetical protein
VCGNDETEEDGEGDEEKNEGERKKVESGEKRRRRWLWEK